MQRDIEFWIIFIVEISKFYKSKQIFLEFTLEPMAWTKLVYITLNYTKPQSSPHICIMDHGFIKHDLFNMNVSHFDLVDPTRSCDLNLTT
jgi:hypothetical protein